MIGLVNYPDTDTDDEDTTPTPACKKIAKNRDLLSPPLPTPLKDSNRCTDTASPEQHQGRVRSFEHERGNWASYVSVAVPHIDDLEELSESLLDVLSSHCTHKYPFHKLDNPHISLSRTLKLRHHWLIDLNQSLEEMCSLYKCFYISLRDLNVYTNDENTRTFVSVKVVSGDEQLLKLVHNLNGVLSSYNLPPFYQEASFHVSLCWCLHNAKDVITSSIREKLQESVDDWIKDNQRCSFFRVDHLVWKAGNKETKLPLADALTS